MVLDLKSCSSDLDIDPIVLTTHRLKTAKVYRTLIEIMKN